LGDSCRISKAGQDVGNGEEVKEGTTRGGETRGGAQKAISGGGYNPGNWVTLGGSFARRQRRKESVLRNPSWGVN